MTKEQKAYVEMICIELPRRDRLEGLAEEASELCKAALKTIRAEKLNKNFTPVTAHQAHEELKEEFMDVLMYAATLGLFPEEINVKFSLEKCERWVNRLNVDPEVKERMLLKIDEERQKKNFASLRRELDFDV